MRQHAADKQHAVVARHGGVRREPLRIDSAENHLRRPLRRVPEDRPAVFADVQVAVIPAVGRDIRRDVPAAAAEVGTEHTAPERTRRERREAARDHMLLVAVDDVRAPHFADHRRGYRIRPLSSHVPRVAGDANVQRSDPFVPLAFAERQQPRRHSIRHVPRELEHVALPAANDPVAGVEQRRNDVQHSPLIVLGRARFQGHAGSGTNTGD